MLGAALVDRQGWPIPVPRDPPGDIMEHVPLIFGVRQDRQPVDILMQMVQDQDLPQAPMQQIRVMEVAAVPVVQEKPQVCRRMQMLPRQVGRRAEQQPSRFAKTPQKRPYGPTLPQERGRSDAVKRRVQEMSKQQPLTLSLMEHTYDPDLQSESLRRFQAGYDQLRAQSSAREQPVTSTPAPSMGGVGRGGGMVLPPQAQSQTNIQPTLVPNDRIFQQVLSSQAA